MNHFHVIIINNKQTMSLEVNFSGDKSAVKLENENVEICDEKSQIGSGDTKLIRDFLSKEEADIAYEKLYGGEIEYQQWYHMPSKKDNLLPLSRLKVAIADTKDNLTPCYRFPVNNQSQYPMFSFDKYPTVEMIKNKLIELTNVPFNHAVVLLYRDGNDCIGFHKDKTLDLSTTSPIASISLGEERSYLLRDNIRCPTKSQEMILNHGSLLLLGPKTNEEWYHSVPITHTSTNIKPRISLTFRVVTTFKNEITGELVGQGETYKEYNWPTELGGKHVDHYDDIISFWLGNENTYMNGLWWHSIHPTNKELNNRYDTDIFIKNKWGYLLDYYIDDKINDIINDNHMLSYWLGQDKNNVDGIFALMILFDQFSRHIYRGSKESFEFDNYAIQLAQYMLNKENLPIAYKFFAYVAMMHSENIGLVSDAVYSLLQLANNETNMEWKKGLTKTSHVAQEHLDILKKYGRYPHRNNILNRENTVDEIDLLSNKKLPKWMTSTVKTEKTVKKSEFDKVTNVDVNKKKLNILVLHSNRQSGYVFKRKTYPILEKNIKEIADLTYCDAPKIYKPTGEIEALIQEKEYYNVPNSNNINVRAWWNATDDPKTMKYQGLEESLEYIESLFKNNQYDGIIGFSQGGTLTGIIASLVSDYRNNKEVSMKLENISRSLKFVIIISGFYCRDTRPEFKNCIMEEIPEVHSYDTVKIRKEFIDIPSFHVWGKDDKLVDPWRSQKLSEAFKNKQTYTHISGHFIKAVKYWPIDKMKEWLKTFVNPCYTVNYEDIFNKIVDFTCTPKVDTDELKKIQNDLNILHKLIEYVIVSKESTSDLIYKLLSLCYDNKTDISDNILIVANNNSDIWKCLIEKDTKNKNDELRKIITTLIASEIKKEYVQYYVNKTCGIPSKLAEYAPKYNSLYRNSRLYHDISTELAKIINIFDMNKLSINEEIEKRQLLLSYNQYRKIISRLLMLIHQPEPTPVARKHIPRTSLQQLLKTPLSDFILNPRAEPVDISSREQLEPLYNYLQNKSQTNLFEDIVFTKGTLCKDGRLDLCKQVIGPTGIKDLIKSLQIDSESTTPMVKHLLLGNNICGNELGNAIGEFIKSGKSALTTWYIAGNDLDETGIEPICDALKNDNKVKQLWLKRNPLRLNGVKHIVDMLHYNKHLQILDLTNTGLMDEGATYLIENLENTSIEYLYLSSNGISAKTCKSIAEKIHKTNLKSLGLGCNRLGDEGVTILSKLLLNPECKLKSLEIASCGIGTEGAKAVAEALKTNTSLVCLNMGFLKSTNDLCEIPNLINSQGAVYIAQMLNENKTLRSLDLVYTGIQQGGITEITKTLTEKNDTLIYLYLEQFGVPHNELSREIIRKKIQRNKDNLDTNTLKMINEIVNPTHLDEVQSVYRVK